MGILEVGRRQHSIGQGLFSIFSNEVALAWLSKPVAKEMRLDLPGQKLLGYQEALNHMRLHSNLIWTRNSFFLLVHTGLLAIAASASIKTGEIEKVLGVAGLFLALIWLWVNWAGQQLQRRWRNLVIDFEQDLFSDIPGPFARAGTSSWRVSITSALLVLSLGFIVLWVLFVLRAWQ